MQDLSLALKGLGILINPGKPSESDSAAFSSLSPPPTVIPTASHHFRDPEPKVEVNQPVPSSSGPELVHFGR